MRVVGIDPGTSNTGLALVDGNTIIATKRLSFTEAVGIDNDALDARCYAIANEVMAWLDDHEHDLVVIEGWHPFSTGSRFDANTFQTPWLVGYLIATLEKRGEDYVIQTSHDVFGTRTRGSLCYGATSAQEGRKKAVESLRNAIEASNDHTRSAACHALYWMLRNGETNE